MGIHQASGLLPGAPHPPPPLLPTRGRRGALPCGWPRRSGAAPGPGADAPGGRIPGHGQGRPGLWTGPAVASGDAAGSSNILGGLSREVAAGGRASRGRPPIQRRAIGQVVASASGGRTRKTAGRCDRKTPSNRRVRGCCRMCRQVKASGYASVGSMPLQAATRPFTASTDLSNMAFSVASSFTSTTRSTPPAPRMTGTPT